MTKQDILDKIDHVSKHEKQPMLDLIHELYPLIYEKQFHIQYIKSTSLKRCQNELSNIKRILNNEYLKKILLL